MRRVLVPLALALATTAGVLTSIERGNRLFRAGEYGEAVEVYRAVLADGEDNPVLRYNLGTALLHLGRYAEAEEHLQAALDVVDPDTREWVYYNLGHRYLEDARATGDPAAATALYEAAVDAYRQALRLRPGDADAKWNYELALQEQERQQRGGGGGGDERDPEQQPQGEGEGQQGQGRPQPSQQEATDPGQGAQAPLSREQAERILSAVEQDERELFQDKLRKGPARTRTVRDW
ncbi:MAG: tetratricopeptide repeat protein [Gemmatimonadota bacterium]